MLKPNCVVNGCNSTASSSKGMCHKHYLRQYRNGSTETINNMSGISCCIIEGCSKKVLAKGLCSKHYIRKYRNGHTNLVRPQSNSSGYVSVQVDGFPVHEHVYLAEKALGKRLPHGAQVHHMNENRSDNYTYFNLVVCPNQRYHALLHKRMRMQKESRLK